MGLLSRQVPIASSVTDYVVRMTLATHPESADAPDVVRRYVRYGVSPRGAQAIVLGSKIRALIEGRLNVAKQPFCGMRYPRSDRKLQHSIHNYSTTRLPIIRPRYVRERYRARHSGRGRAART